jgi:hypothetical protein
LALFEQICNSQKYSKTSVFQFFENVLNFTFCSSVLGISYLGKALPSLVAGICTYYQLITAQLEAICTHSATSLMPTHMKGILLPLQSSFDLFAF